jgi:hypothetical protein
MLGPQRLKPVFEVVFQLFFSDRVLMIHIGLGEAAPHEIGNFFLGEFPVFIRVGLSEENIDPPLAGVHHASPAESSMGESAETSLATEAALHARTTRVKRVMEREPSMNPDPSMLVSRKSSIAAKAVPEFMSAPKLRPPMVGPTITAASSVAKSRPTVSAMMPPVASVKPSPSLVSVEIMAAAEVTPAKMMPRLMTGPFVSVAASKTGSATLATEVMATAMFGQACRELTARVLTPGPLMVAATRTSLGFALHTMHPHPARSAIATLPGPPITAFCKVFAAPEISSTTAMYPRSALVRTAIGKLLPRTRAVVAPVSVISVATSLVPVVVAQIAPGFTSLVIQLIRAHFVRRRTPFRPCRELRQTGCRDSAQKKQHIVPHDKTTLRLTRSVPYSRGNWYAARFKISGLTLTEREAA